MMYDHNKKAGNQGDVVKHTALIAAAGELIAKSKGTFKYADTFAGYPINLLRSDGEWRNGIDKLWRTGREPATSAVKFWRELWWCRVGLRRLGVSRIIDIHPQALPGEETPFLRATLGYLACSCRATHERLQHQRS